MEVRNWQWGTWMSLNQWPAVGNINSHIDLILKAEAFSFWFLSSDFRTRREEEGEKERSAWKSV